MATTCERKRSRSNRSEGGAADGCPRPCVGYYVLGMNRMVTGRPDEAIALVPEMESEHDRVDAAEYDRGSNA